MIHATARYNLKRSAPKTLRGKAPKIIFFPGPPRAERAEQQQVVRLGDDVRIRCPIEGYPTPMVAWSKGDENIDYTWDRLAIDYSFFILLSTENYFYISGI